MIDTPIDESIPLSTTSTSSPSLSKISPNPTSPDIESQPITPEQEKIYGNLISIKKPIHMGKTLTLLYYKGNPLIVIGPDCKNIQYNSIYRSIYDNINVY